MKSILKILKPLIPKTYMGKLFGGLTFLNFGIGAFFASIGDLQSMIFGSITAVCCSIIWYRDLPTIGDHSE